MEIWSVVRALTRQWMIVTFAILVTAGLALAAFVALPATYSAQSQVLLLPPGQATLDAVRVNPYLALSPTLSATGQALASALSGNGVQQSMRAAGLSTDYTVTLDSNGSGPVLDIDAPGKSAVAALRSQAFILAALRSELAQEQTRANAPAGTLITAQTIVSDAVAHRSIGKRVRSVAALALLGLLGAGWLGITVDALRESRRTRRARSSAPQQPVKPTVSPPGWPALPQTWPTLPTWSALVSP